LRGNYHFMQHQFGHCPRKGINRSIARPVPESPRRLLKYGRDKQAASILRRVGGGEYADYEIRDIKKHSQLKKLAYLMIIALNSAI